MKSGLLIIVILLGYIIHGICQKSNDVFVDNEGVMRWPDGKEVYGFGVNYTVPFAHAYRSANRLGVDPKKAIDDDVYHFARLGFDAYRVHVWDTEISDSVGNLLENEHLELFDYMLNEMKKRGLKFILTPIAFWGNGWPEPNEKTPGFSHKFGKEACLTNEDAIKAQENYLYQFLNHVNQYTGLAYKDDPDIVAVEISNEPHHREAAPKVTDYISRLVRSMRNTGCAKPIFYNVSHSVHLAEAYFNAHIQGGTFQWYPTGLGFQKELRGNMLPNVDNYAIPFDDMIKKSKGAKIVYEFDAADVGRSYIYPAMARSFRSAGIQWATHFSYDPTFMAYANTEYNTHFMNLAYAPQKALSLKIASEVFHQIPMGKYFGTYPENTTFDDFHVSYEHDLAEMVTQEKFFYTNHTSTAPKSMDKLNEIAGFGNSSVVRYGGAGAYFLDRLDKGIWRLEVMPDAIWIDNLFGRNSLDNTRAVIKYRSWLMKINLPDLGNNFAIEPLNEGNRVYPEVKGTEFTISPGTYLVRREGVHSEFTGDNKWKNIKLNEFIAPETTVERTVVAHTPIQEIETGNAYTLTATVVASAETVGVAAWVISRYRGKRYEMKEKSAYEYSVTIPADDVEEGFLRYYILLDDGKEVTTYPGEIAKQPSDWDFPVPEPYQVKVLSSSSRIFLFDALTDYKYINSPWTRGLKLEPLAEPGKAAYHMNPEKLFVQDLENTKTGVINDFSMRFFFGDKLIGRKNSLKSKKCLVVSGNALNGKNCSIQVALVDNQGQAYGAVMEFSTSSAEYKVMLSDLKPVKLVTLPRPYPSFLPYYFEREQAETFDIGKIEALQLSIGPGISKEDLESRHGIAIENIWLD